MLSSVKDTWERFWGWSLVAGALLVGAVYYDTVSEQEAYVECQTALNQKFIESLSARSAVASASDDAQGKLLLGVSELFTLPPTFDPKETAKREKDFRALFLNYQKSVEDVAKVRAENPYPDLDNPC